MFFNGVYFQFQAADIKKTDQREDIYCREQVPHIQIKPLGLTHIEPGVYWVYVQKGRKIIAPSQRYPISQSYVDIFLGGCIEVGERYRLKNFAQQCIT